MSVPKPGPHLPKPGPQKFYIAFGAACFAGTITEVVRRRLQPAGIVKSAPGIEFAVYSAESVNRLKDQLDRQRRRP